MSSSRCITSQSSRAGWSRSRSRGRASGAFGLYSPGAFSTFDDLDDEGRRSTDTPALVEPSKVAIRSGHFYAHRLINDLGIDPDDGVVRVSMVHYNTAREVERLIRALDRAF